MSVGSPSTAVSVTPRAHRRCTRRLRAVSGADPGVPTVAVAGDLDMAATNPVAASLEGLLAQGHRVVVVNLSGVTFLDCAGLSVLIRMHRRFEASGASLIIVGAGRPVVRVIELADLQDVLPVTASAADAQP